MLLPLLWPCLVILSVTAQDVRDTTKAELRVKHTQEKFNKWAAKLKRNEERLLKEDATSKDLMYLSMATISKFTCIRFETRAREYDYVRIMNMTTCAAMVGHNSGRNDVFLHEPNCMSKGTIMHELLHIVGFQHEQSRSDRDDYVDVIFDNIVQQGSYHLNFNRHDTKNLVVYDYNSVMHYPRLSWGKKPYLQTIIPKIFPHARLGQRSRLSPHDIEEVRNLYQCSENTYNRCGEDFESTHGRFSSPNHPNQYDPESHCNWLMTASPGNYIELTIVQVDMPASPACEDDMILIHDGSTAAAPVLGRMCGKQSKSVVFKSSGQTMYVLFGSSPQSRNGFKGFNANFREVREAGPGAPPIIGNDYGPVSGNMPSEFLCAFKNSKDPFCGMSQEGLLYDFKWTIGKNFSKNKKTGPQPTKTKQRGGIAPVLNATCSVRYMTALSKNREIADRARIMTEWMTPTPKCIEYMYYMFGGSLGSLSLVAVEMDNTGGTFERTITEIHGNQGAQFATKKTNWETTSQTIRAVKFIFDAWIYGDESDIAVDNIAIKEGCSEADIQLLPGFQCDFENGDKCGAVDDDKADFSWLMNSGVTPSKSTGPLGDHTTGRSSGQYLFIEASQPRVRGDRAMFTTPPLTEELHCLSFWYHMYGQETGSMRVRVKIGKNGRDRIIWEEVGEKPDKWFKAEVEINPKYFQNDVSLNVRKMNEAKENENGFDDGTRENDADGDITYEDEIEEGMTSDYSSDFVLIGEEEETEDMFEYQFTNSSSSRRRRQAGMPLLHRSEESESTAIGIHAGIIMTQLQLTDIIKAIPTLQNDAVGFKKIKERGIYITIEAERGFGYRGDSALDDIKITNMPCSTWGEWGAWGACSKTCGGGVQTRSRECFLNNKLKCDGKFKEEQTCSMHVCGGWSCNFNRDMCGIGQMKDDDFDWTRNKGYTPSAMTGPTRDISGNGYYMFIEGSSPQKTGDKARLQTPWFPATTDYCLSFYYHMWGNVTDMPAAVGSLKVIILLKGKSGNQMKEVFSKRDDQGKKWHKAIVNLNNIHKFEYFSLAIQAQRGYSYRSDIAIDELTLTNTNCQKANDLMDQIETSANDAKTKLDEGMALCSFNWNKGSFCGWNQMNSKKEDQGDFIRTNEATPSKQTGPEEGTGLFKRDEEKDHYIFIEGSDLDEGHSAILESKPLAPIPYCLSLDYHMYGKGTGSISVLAWEKPKVDATAQINIDEAEEETSNEEETGLRAARLLSQVKYDQGNMWHPWEVTFTPELKNGTGASEVHFYVKATRGKTWASDIALDNLMVKAGPCINLEQVESERFVASWPTMLDLVNYDITLLPETAGFINGNTTLNKMDVSELQPETVYNLTMITNLASGRSFTNFRQIKTMPILGDVALGYVKSTEMKIKWVHNDKFIGYKMTIFPRVEGFDEGLRLGNQTAYSITGLKAGTQYAITVQGVGADSIRHVSNIVRKYFSTAPPSPTMIAKPTSDSIELIWNADYQLVILQLTPTPPKWPNNRQFLPKGQSSIVLTDLAPETSYQAEIFALIGYSNGFRPSGPQDVVKSLGAPFAMLTDVEQISAQTAPSPPVLKIEDRRRDSVKVSWDTFGESEEASFLVRLNPPNGQYYSTADTDVTATWITLENLDPDVEYELQVVAKFDSHRQTSPATTKIRVNCDQSHYLVSTGLQLGAYKFGTSWTMCGWFRLGAPGMFMQLVTQTGRIMAATRLPDDHIGIDFGVDQNGLPRRAMMAVEGTSLEFVCIVNNGDEGIVNTYHKSQLVASILFQSKPFVGMAMIKGPASVIDFSVWDYALSDLEISLQQRGQCISGMMRPSSALPPSNAPRLPVNPTSTLIEILSTRAIIDLGYSSLLSGIYVELQPSSSSFRNGIQGTLIEHIVLDNLTPSTEYTLKFGGIIAGLSSELDEVKFTTAPAAPTLTTPLIRSSTVAIQWSTNAAMESYVLELPDANQIVRDVEPGRAAFRQIGNLEGNTEYTIGVQGIMASENGDRYATDMTYVTFTTAPVISNAETEFVRSTSFALKWDIDADPDQYRVIVSPEISGILNGITELDQTGRLVIEGADADTSYSVTLVGLLKGKETDPVELKLHTTPLVVNAAVRASRSTMMLIGWNMVSGATDVDIQITPPMEGPTALKNGRQERGTVRNMITLLGLKPVTRYEIAISMVFDDKRQTDATYVVQETAPSSSGLVIDDISSTSFKLTWDAIANVETYKVLIRPTVTGFDGSIGADENREITVTGLEPDTSYTVFVSGILFNGIMTDPTASKARTTPLLAPPMANMMRSSQATFTLTAPDVDASFEWDVQVRQGGMESESGATLVWNDEQQFNIVGLSPDTEYTVTAQAKFENAATDPSEVAFRTAPMAPSLELRNVQSTAFNILWYKTYSTINYRITIDPPVGDFENGLLFENEDDGEDQSDYLSIYEADSVTDYTITLTAILADGVETDPVSETVQTAFIMEPPSVSDITETAAYLTWDDHTHGDDEEDHDDDEEAGSGASDIDEIDVDFGSTHRHARVINYRININPPLDGTNGRTSLLANNMTLSGLRPATEYRVELFAVLTTGAETDLAEAVFTTTGQQVTVNQSLCALSYASLESSETVASACDFEDGTMCGWYQDRQSAKSYSWRIDTERSVSKSDKSNLNRDIIQMTGRPANGKVLVAPYRRASSNDEAKLYSPMLSGPKCLELEVLMFRKSVASFTVSVLSEKGISKLVELNGPQGQQWVPLQHSIFLPETLNYKVT